MTWLFVAIGGAIGASLRYGIQTAVTRWLDTPFPVAILAINVVGSTLIGLVAGALSSSRLMWAGDTRAFVVAGILGGFTTFSSFSLDTLVLMRSGHAGLAVLNVAGQVGLSLAAVYIGFRIAS